MKTSVKLMILASVLWTASPCRATTIQEIVDGVTLNSYSNFHAGLFVSDGNSRGFTDGPSPRVPAYEHDAARDFIHSSFQAMGFDTWLDPFEFIYSTGHTYTNCNNVVAIKRGSVGANVYIIGAHYDSVDSGQNNISGICPGADDNASGTAAILEAARAIKDYTFRDTLIFIAFDAEEKDYKGSKHFVNEHITTLIAATNATTFLKSDIQAMINLDTIAYDDTNSLPYVVVGRVKGASAVATVAEGAVSSYTALSPFSSSGYNESDQKIFYEAGIDSIHFIEYDFHNYSGFPNAGSNPYNHKTGDSVDSPGYISFSYATEITKAVVGTVCEAAGVIPPATLTQSLATNNTLEIRWLTTPDVAYSLYGGNSLLQTNLWTFIQYFPPSNETVEFSIQLDLSTVTQSMFKVESH